LKSMRRFSHSVHLWTGLITAILLFVEGVTGGIMAWGPEVHRVLNSSGSESASTVYRVPARPALPLDQIAAILERQHPGFRLRTVRFSPHADLAWSAGLQCSPFHFEQVLFDPHTGETLRQQTAPRRHVWLQTLIELASRIHGHFVSGITLFLLALSGVILWWPRKIFMPRKAGPSARTNFDLHNTIGFYSSLVLMIFALTAMVMAFPRPAIDLIARITHTAALPPAPYKRDFTASARGSRPLDLDESLKAAVQLRPDAQFIEMRNNNNGDTVYLFYDLPGGAHDVKGLLLVNPISGKVQQFQVPRNLTRAERAVVVRVRQIHTGEILGSPSRWIAGFFSFMLALLAITGPVIWWNRRYGAQRS
jgi:uncharacterized iron-regulated membrane protein